jgi:hypothetical protein
MPGYSDYSSVSVRPSLTHGKTVRLWLRSRRIQLDSSAKSNQD